MLVVQALAGILFEVEAGDADFARRIDRSLTEDALRKVRTRPPDRLRARPEDVIELVATFFQTVPAALASRSRRRDVLLPRQLAMYLCHRYTQASLSEIARAFDRLRPKDRMILVLHHVEERPVAEIARSLGIPVGTAKWRLHAARAALEKAMEAEA